MTNEQGKKLEELEENLRKLQIEVSKIQGNISKLQDEINALKFSEVSDERIVANNKVAKDTIKLELKITKLLHQLGVPTHIIGYQYLREAICIVFYKRVVPKNLYTEIAKKYDSTSSRVERAMRNAIAIAWRNESVPSEIVSDIFGHTIPKKGKPTNIEFIAILADYLRLRLR